MMQVVKVNNYVDAVVTASGIYIYKEGKLLIVVLYCITFYATTVRISPESA